MSSPSLLRRGEKIGGTVGYSIRLESVCSKATRLMFCTTGILLRRLEEDTLLDGASSLIFLATHSRGTAC